MKSLAAEDLAKVVPHPGLADTGRRPPNAHRTPNKVLRSAARWVERGMPRLRDIANEGRE